MKGQGPLVLFFHGFPELWYSWRRQILSLAARGYFAVPPDLRGYGVTDGPPDLSAYTIFHLFGDLVALIESLGQEKVFVVGLASEAVLQWNLCLLRPDRVTALVNWSVAFAPHNPFRRSVDSCICKFQRRFYCGMWEIIVMSVEGSHWEEKVLDKADFLTEGEDVSYHRMKVLLAQCNGTILN
ncbi:hypothetical protein HPP92_013252 [Vanilla planifolia]|uniref:AB hydrolase-1 domain-containing protein n=1 Tax=Vanilla planifolia TaxID=51239 RepID=A0A835R223_VANPL|nr:hypothetical protein HPP92_013252 [Vanilla planifolia]